MIGHGFEKLEEWGIVMSDGREEREEHEKRREQDEREDRQDRVNPHLPDQWKPERRES